MPKTQQQIVDEANIAGQKASDVLGQDFTAGTIETYFPNQAETKPTTPLPSAPTTPSQYYSRNTEQEQQAENILSAPMTTESTEQIQARKTKQAQGEIDALNRLYASKISEQREVNVGQERRTSSVSTLTGLAGSSEAGVQARKTEAIGGKQIEAIQNEQAVMIQSVLSDIRTSAVEEARQQTLDARQSAEDVLALRTQRQTDAVAKLTTLGQSATASLEGLRATLSPEDYDYLIRNAGGEAMAEAILFNSHSEQAITKSERIGDFIARTITMPDGTSKQEYIPIPEEVLATEEGQFDTMDTDNGTFITQDGGKTWTPLLGSIKPPKATPIEEVEADADISELDPTSQSILAQTGLSIPAYSFLTTGVKALTRMTSGDRKKFMAEAENWSIDNGVDIATFQSQFNAFNEVVQRNIKISALVGLAGEDIKGSLSELTRLTEKEGFGDVKIKNLVKIMAGEQLGDPVALQYKFILDDLRSAVSGFFAVQQGRTSTMDSDRADAKELINNGLASGSVSGLITTINNVAARTEQIATDSVGLAQNKIWEMFGVTRPNGTGEQDQYAEFRSQIGEGEILIQRGNDVMAITEEELQPNDTQL